MNKHTAWLQRVDNYVLQEISNPYLVVADMAGAVYMSERQFFRRIKKATGITPHRYLLDIRLREAKRMAENKQVRSVAELAKAVGYVRTDYFSRIFRERYGKSPSDLLGD